MGENLDKLQDNLSKIETLSKRLVTALGQRPASDAGLQGPGQDIYMKAGVAYLNAMINNPTKLFEHQVQYWGKALTHFLDAQQELAKGHFTPPEDTAPNDKRFSNPLWQGHPYFNFVKQQYFFLANAIRQAVEDLEDLDPADKKRIEFLATQVIDLFSPTNYLATNPDALERAVKTDGQSLVQGLENLVRDIETHRGEALPTLADPNAFEIGKNIATTKGAVVFRNDMMEVIQYAPTTDTVHRIPLVIFPPWINKFYILDLKPGNSLIKWLVDQGYTLFIVSWKNPDQTYADMGLEDYVEKGYLTAIETAKTITQQTQVNVVGYCIAGTALALTLALLKKRGDQSVRSASFFTTLTDFSDHGEFTPFLQNDFVDAIERQVQAEGILDSHYMSKTFSFLRANDLIYGPAVRSYMMGEAPPVFDLLYWNGDSTNLPGKMALQYLRNLCQRNQFADTGLAFLDTTLRLSDITLPICAVACETDHIAAWKDSYQGVVRMGSRNKTFILAESGHIAGIVNPPAKNKYGYYIGSDARGTPDAWQARATYTKGSWWPYWEDWLSKRAGKHVAARNLDEDGQNILAPAPGTYVLEKAGG